MGGGRNGEFSVATARKQGTDQIAFPPFRYTGTDSGDLPRCFKARKVRRTGRRRVTSGPLEHIRPVHP